MGHKPSDGYELYVQRSKFNEFRHREMGHKQSYQNVLYVRWSKRFNELGHREMEHKQSYEYELYVQ